MVIFQYNLYIFGIHLWTVLYPKPCYNEPCYKEVVVLSIRLHVCPAKLCLHICTVWSVFTVRLKSIWILDYPQSTLQGLRMCRLIWVFTGRTCRLVGNAVPSSNVTISLAGFPSVQTKLPFYSRFRNLSPRNVNISDTMVSGKWKGTKIPQISFSIGMKGNSCFT